MENEVLPKIFLDFLNIRHFPSVPKTESCGWVGTAAWLQYRKIKQFVAVFVVGQFCSQTLERLCGLTSLSFMLFSSFDTESMESRWVILSVLLSHKSVDHVLVLLFTQIVRQAACWTLPAQVSFFFYSFSVNCLISQWWFISEIHTCFLLHSVRSHNMMTHIYSQYWEKYFSLHRSLLLLFLFCFFSVKCFKSLKNKDLIHERKNVL